MRVDELERELREERPELDQDFARRLDEWAAAGFPRDRGLGPRAHRGRGSGLMAASEPRLGAGRLGPAAAGADACRRCGDVLVVVSGSTVSQLGDPDGADRAAAPEMTPRSAIEHGRARLHLRR